MAGAYYRKVLPGDGAQVPARVWNQLLDLAAGQDFDQTGDGPGLVRQADIITIRNDTSGGLDRFSILGLNGPLITPANNLTEFKRRVTFSGITPTAAAHTGKYAILLDPIPQAGIGRAWLSGICPVQIAPQTPATPLATAEVNDGQTGTLVDSASGTAQILWIENNSNAKQWAIVRFGTQPAAGSTTNGLFDYKSRGWLTSTESPDNAIDGYLQAPGGLLGNWPITLTPVANTIYAFPIQLGPSPIGANPLGPFFVGVVWVQTAGSSGANARIGLYKNAAPSGLILEGGWVVGPALTGGLLYDSGDIPCDSSISPPGFSPGANGGMSPLSPGVFWLCIQFNSVGTMPVVGGANTASMGGFYGVRGFGGWAVPFGLTKAKTYAPWNADNPFGNTGTLDCSMIVGAQNVPIPVINY